MQQVSDTLSSVYIFLFEFKLELFNPFCVMTETTLIKTLTKINRMDIVHLIETKIMKSSEEETTSHTYAEIERTIALDHSEGTQANVTLKQNTQKVIIVCFPVIPTC